MIRGKREAAKARSTNHRFFRSSVNLPTCAIDKGIIQGDSYTRTAEVFQSASFSTHGTFTESRFSEGTYFTAAVRSSLSHANLRPSSARFNVLNRTTENSWR